MVVVVVVRARAVSATWFAKALPISLPEFGKLALPPLNSKGLTFMVLYGRLLESLRRFTKYGFAVGVALAGSAGPPRTRFGPGSRPVRVIGAEVGAFTETIGPISRQDGPENHANHKLCRSVPGHALVCFSRKSWTTTTANTVSTGRFMGSRAQFMNNTGEENTCMRNCAMRLKGRFVSSRARFINNTGEENTYMRNCATRKC